MMTFTYKLKNDINTSYTIVLKVHIGLSYSSSHILKNGLYYICVFGLVMSGWEL